MSGLNILVLDDEKGFRDEIGEFLRKRDYKVHEAGIPSQAFEIIRRKKIDIALLDIFLPEMDGLTVLQRIKKSYPDIEIIMMTGHGDMESVIKALRFGATDFFKKPFKLEEVHKAITNTTKFVKVVNRLKYIEGNHQTVSEKLQKHAGAPLIGKSDAIRTIIEQMTRVADSKETTVLITGKSGTGKELIAKGIHYLSERRDEPFISVNCSAIPAELFESEFFGHTKGAFTNATSNKTGWFEAANQGTLFLDEIGDLDYNLQSKLLRVIEEKVVSKIGSKAPVELDVRIIAATNKGLGKLAQSNRFREDLYHRLNNFVIQIPSLKERKEDVRLLIDYFISDMSQKLNKKIKGIHEEVIQSLMEYDFPGNVRELKNMIERAIIMSDEKILKLHHFPHLSFMTDISVTLEEEDVDGSLDLEKIEKRSIIRALKATQGHKTKAAELLKITRQALNRKLDKHDIDPDQINPDH